MSSLTIMNSENFAEWQRRQGKKVFQTESSFWFEAGPCVLQAFPYHKLITPSEKELRDLLVKKNYTALRYSTPVDSPEGKLSYHVIKKSPYSLEHIKKRSRRSISRGLSRCSIEEISMGRLATEGWLLQKETLERQNRQESMNLKHWQKLCLSAEGIPGFKAWGAIIGEELGAYLLTTQIDDVCEFLFAGSSQKFFEYHVNHVIFYSIAHKMLLNSGVNSLYITMQSLDAPASVDDFKVRIGLDPVPVRQRIYFHPIVKPFITPGAHKVLLLLQQFSPHNNFLSKMEGMVRFYLDGKPSLKEQKIPDILKTDHSDAEDGIKDPITLTTEWNSLNKEFSK